MARRIDDRAREENFLVCDPGNDLSADGCRDSGEDLFVAMTQEHSVVDRSRIRARASPEAVERSRGAPATPMCGSKSEDHGTPPDAWFVARGQRGARAAYPGSAASPPRELISRSSWPPGRRASSPPARSRPRPPGWSSTGCRTGSARAPCAPERRPGSGRRR